MKQMHRLMRASAFAVGALTPALTFGQGLPLPTNEGIHTFVSLDTTTITSGSPVNVLTPGHAIAGGYIWTDTSTASVAGAKLCVNQKGPAGTVTGGDTMCFGAGGAYQVYPSTLPVSMNVSAGTVTVSGYGFIQ